MKLNNTRPRPVALIILDGVGLRNSKASNAVKLAKAPHINSYFANYPFTQLEACGESVGLPKGYMGNSEVGHLTLGAGRIVLQDMSLIDDSIRKCHSHGEPDHSGGGFFVNQAILGAINHAKKHNSALHLMGLLSDAGVHSHINHLFALLDLCKEQNFSNVHIHCFMDGRDTPPKAGLKYISMLENKLRKIKLGRISTVCGRYYAMDRDKRWDRQQKAYDLLVHLKGKKYKTAKEAVLDNYKHKLTDEFIEPSVIGFDMSSKNNKSAPACSTPIKHFDSIIFFNFRSDRARQITRALTQRTFRSFKTRWIRNLYFVGMVKYEKSLRIKVAFPPKIIKNSMGEFLSKHNKLQLRIAETEKYAHVTFFFNAGIEKPYRNEHRILVNSPKVATYDLQPEMNAKIIKEKLLDDLFTGKNKKRNQAENSKYDFILINFANGDMVGHTGKLNAAIKAVETLDSCLGEIVPRILAAGGACIITADHGNCEEMKGKFATSHTLNRVPFVIVSNDPLLQKSAIKLDKGHLYDVCPTVLDIMRIQKPVEMTGKSLIKK